MADVHNGAEIFAKSPKLKKRKLKKLSGVGVLDSSIIKDSAAESGNSPKKLTKKRKKLSLDHSSAQNAGSGSLLESGANLSNNSSSLKKRRKKAKLSTFNGIQIDNSASSESTLTSVKICSQGEQLSGASNDKQASLSPKKKARKRKKNAVISQNEKLGSTSNQVEKLNTNLGDTGPKKQSKTRKKMTDGTSPAVLTPTTASESGKNVKKRKKLAANAQDSSETGQFVKKQKSGFDRPRIALPVTDKSLYSMDKSELNQLVTDARKRGFSDQAIKLMVKKYHRREERRLQRADERENTRACYNCREIGHVLAECPQTTGDPEMAVSCCFKCGNHGHTSRACHLKIKAYPFATCFICKEKGHLSRQCPKNDHGIFPHGGSCSLCGEVDHQKGQCPRNIQTEDAETGGSEYVLEKQDFDQGNIDDEPAPKSNPANKSRVKVVKF